MVNAVRPGLQETLRELRSVSCALLHPPCIVMEAYREQAIAILES